MLNKKKMEIREFLKDFETFVVLMNKKDSETNLSVVDRLGKFDVKNITMFSYVQLYELYKNEYENKM